MGLIREEDIDQVREKADIVDVVSTHVQLKKAGRLHKGLCPFHNEKTPSFMVDPEKQLFHCFGCGEGGNVFSFVMKTERMDFPEAVKYLAQRVNYALQVDEEPAVRKALLGKQQRLYELNQRALAFYQKMLSKDQGKPVVDYLKKRGYKKQTIEKFMLGYAPDDWEVLTKAAIKQGCLKEDLIEAGLSVKSDKDTRRLYDRFRGRLMFPILDLQGRVVGFGGRVLGDELPKYLNSPETMIYHKGKMLYGLNWARQSVIDSGEVIIVEGYTDVISLYQAGINNVVATLGTALTEDHLRLLARFAKRIILVFDADIAGEKAIERGISLIPDFYLGPEHRNILELVDQRHIDLFVVSLPRDTDPADYVGQQGAENFLGLVAKATPLIDFCIESEIASFDMTRSEQKNRAAAAAIEIIATLPSAVAHEQYLKKVAERIDISYDALFSDFKKMSNKKINRQRETAKNKVVSKAMGPYQKVEREALKACLGCAESRDLLISELINSYFTIPEHQALMSIMQEEYMATGKIEVARLIDRISDAPIKELATGLATEDLKVDESRKYAQELLKRLKEFDLRRRIDTLKAELKKVNPERESQQYDRLFENLLELEAARRELR